MRSRFHVALGAFTAAALVGCTAFVAVNLSDTNGTVQHYVGGCFKMQDTTCGKCIADNCENPNDQQKPVSLQKVCALDQYATIIGNAQGCAQNASVGSYECTNLFVTGGAYASSIDDENAAVNNVKKCITDNCVASCSRCEVQVPTCENQTIDLLEAGACGNCIDKVMNQPGGDCQPFILDGSSCYTYQNDPVATCAIPSGSCGTPSCNALSNADAGINDCIWQHCGPSGTNECPNP